jgi:hypothetical protein
LVPRAIEDITAALKHLAIFYQYAQKDRRIIAYRAKIADVCVPSSKQNPQPFELGVSLLLPATQRDWMDQYETSL